MPPDQRPPPPDDLTLLAHGDVEILGRLPWSSNATLLARCATGDASIEAVYKPGRGERTLWDFPDGLFRREVAAFVLSEALGWGLVPETVLREEAPFGPGSLQRFVPADFSAHYFTIVDDETWHPALRRLAAFDVVANNADRKSGHLLVGDDRRLWAIDNALAFHRLPKLRTVVWEFAGDPIAPDDRDALDALAADPPERLGDFLDPLEVTALCERARSLAAAGALPHPDPDVACYPWPLV